MWSPFNGAPVASTSPEAQPPSLKWAARFDLISRFSDRLAESASILLIGLGVGNVVLSALGRFLGISLVGNATLEGQWYLFALSFLLGTAGTLRENQHVRVDVLSSRLSERGRAVLDLLGALMLLFPFCVFAVWSTIPMVERSLAIWEASSDPGGLPRWPLKLVVPAAFFLLAVQGMANVLRSWPVILRRNPT